MPARCPVDALLETLDDDRLEVAHMILGDTEDGAWTDQGLATALLAIAPSDEVTEDTVKEHRSRSCSCHPDDE